MEDTRAEHLNELLAELVAAASGAFGARLKSVVLFGSAAEGRLRPASDVNLLFLLDALDPAGLDAFREPLRVAQSALKARAMFLLAHELPVAAELFAVKFSDMKDRHRVLYGSDPLAELSIDPAALRLRLREVLLNLALRLRERYVAVSLREEQIPPLLADAAGPLRAAASALIHLRGSTPPAPREALEMIAAELNDPAIRQAVDCLPVARQTGLLAPGQGGPALLSVARLADHLRQALEATQPTS